jgi:hypothetical protein
MLVTGRRASHENGTLWEEAQTLIGAMALFDDFRLMFKYEGDIPIIRLCWGGRGEVASNTM